MFRRKWSILLFLLPGLSLLILFNIIPFFSGIQYSVTDGTKANRFERQETQEAGSHLQTLKGWKHKFSMCFQSRAAFSLRGGGLKTCGANPPPVSCQKQQQQQENRHIYKVNSKHSGYFFEDMEVTGRKCDPDQ